jgi:hypothetical protein
VRVTMPHEAGVATVVAEDVELSPAGIASHLWGGLCNRMDDEA